MVCFLSDLSLTKLIKSRQRIADHGEVFTPTWLVEEMLNLVSEEASRIDSRFLEPACGSGNFLCSVLTRKLITVQSKYGKSDFERRHYALFSIMCIYGIELLGDNVIECRSNLLSIYTNFLSLKPQDIWYKAAQVVLEANIIQGDALSLTSSLGKHIEFPEWGYLGAGKYQRRDFRFDSLTQSLEMQGTLFELFNEVLLSVPAKSYPKMNTKEISS